MYKRLKEHESYIIKLLDSVDSNDASDSKDKVDWVALREFHKAQIEFLQHERLVHLLVTLAISLFFLVSVFFSITIARFELFLLDALFLALLVPYLIHYYLLENGVQRLYHLFNRIQDKISS